MLQGRTALADTPGSAFYRKCEELIAEDKFDALLDAFIETFDVLFARAPEGVVTCYPKKPCVSGLFYLILSCLLSSLTSSTSFFGQALAVLCYGALQVNLKRV